MNRREQGEAVCRQIAAALQAELSDTTTGPPMGFMLMIFDFDDDPRAERFSAYVSNARRADMVKLLREQADRMEAGTDATKGSVS